MNLVSKLIYQAHKKGLGVCTNDGVKLKNSITKKYVHILPNGKVCSDDILGHDEDLKCLMPEDFMIKDPILGSFICIPCEVSLHVGKDTDQREISFAKHCIEQCFAYIKKFQIIKDDDLLSSECRIEHGFVLTYKERQTFIKACLDYLK